MLGVIRVCVAGLVAVTPAAGFVPPMSAVVIGLVAGVVCYLMVARVKGMLGYDHSRDAFGIHGVDGTVGALLTGIFATQAINPIFTDTQGTAVALGLPDGNGGQLLSQFVGVVIAWVLAGVATLVVLKTVDVVVGLRVPDEHEVQGLDLSQHGEEGYSLEA